MQDICHSIDSDRLYSYIVYSYSRLYVKYTKTSFLDTYAECGSMTPC